MRVEDAVDVFRVFLYAFTSLMFLVMAINHHQRGKLYISVMLSLGIYFMCIGLSVALFVSGTIDADKFFVLGHLFTIPLFVITVVTAMYILKNRR